MIRNDVPVSAAVCTDAGTTPAEIRWESRQRRHRLVAHLESRPDGATVDELVDALASDDGESLEPTRLRIRLVHVDIPRLEDAGAIGHDPERGSVRLVGEPDWYRTET
ncbi:DUF7344 domain-containing protein [Natrinema amylolyticum]|uniref:DUF7344 domain-containing protein n=1 Tax=Natrinema amylolyticum TaxID=2878679 RepID=UPI001CF950B9|nr:hypothetical protein [Natrinema amylolyticum]